MLDVGSTMTMEAWDIKYKPNLDWNHAWGAAPASIIVRKMMGIEPLTPGYKSVKIKPQVGNLTAAKLKTPTIRGSILCEWKTTGSGFSFAVTVPANMTALVYLPVSDPASVKEGNISALKALGVKFVRVEKGFVVFEVQAGTYNFAT